MLFSLNMQIFSLFSPAFIFCNLIYFPIYWQMQYFNYNNLPRELNTDSSCLSSSPSPQWAGWVCYLLTWLSWEQPFTKTPPEMKKHFLSAATHNVLCCLLEIKHPIMVSLSFVHSAVWWPVWRQGRVCWPGNCRGCPRCDRGGSHFDGCIFLSKTEAANLAAAHNVDERMLAQA